MDSTNFNALVAGKVSKAATLDQKIKSQLRNPKTPKEEKKKLLTKFVQENQQPIDTTLHNRIQRRIRKLNKRKWSDTKIRNHIKKHFQIMIVEEFA